MVFLNTPNTTVIVFSPKLVAEQELFGIDFTKLLASGETIVSATPRIVVTSGNNHTTTSMLVGSASISGNKVLQMIKGGYAGNTYAIHFAVVTSLSQKLEPVGTLAVTN